MGGPEKRARFHHLREKEESGTLTPAEQAELTAMIEEIESAEAAYLAPVIERLEAEAVQIEGQNAALQHLIQRKQKVVRRLEQILAEAKAEEDAIQQELDRILSGGAPASS